jgi:hypothetical protein
MFTELCGIVGNCYSIRKLFGPTSGHNFIAFVSVGKPPLDVKISQWEDTGYLNK